LAGVLGVAGRAGHAGTSFFDVRTCSIASVKPAGLMGIMASMFLMLMFLASGLLASSGTPGKKEEKVSAKLSHRSLSWARTPKVVRPGTAHFDVGMSTILRWLDVTSRPQQQEQKPKAWENS
jgi:hypothetical protein